LDVDVHRGSLGRKLGGVRKQIGHDLQ
jgi:hypothetical protein